MLTAFESPLALDQPLPDELTGRAQGWFTRYRRWPVFSAPWARARIRAWSIPVGLTLIFIAGGAALASHDGLPWAAVLGIALQVVPPLLIGPWIGVWVRRQAWPAAREGWVLLAAMALVAVVTVACAYVAAEPLKQWIAERIGDVDESGQRRKIALQIGVTVLPVDRPASAAAIFRARAATGPRQPGQPGHARPAGVLDGRRLCRHRLASRAHGPRHAGAREGAGPGAGGAARGRTAAVGAGGAGGAAFPVQHPGRRAQRHCHRPGAGQRDDRPPGGLSARRHPAPAQRWRQRRGHAGRAIGHRARLPGPDGGAHAAAGMEHRRGARIAFGALARR